MVSWCVDNNNKQVKDKDKGRIMTTMITCTVIIAKAMTVVTPHCFATVNVSVRYCTDK